LIAAALALDALVPYLTAALSGIEKIALYLLILGVLILFHEFGHMVVAKRAGVGAGAHVLLAERCAVEVGQRKIVLSSIEEQGVVGLGPSEAFLERARALGFAVAGYDPLPPPGEAPAAEMMSLDELLACPDIVSVHAGQTT